MFENDPETQIQVQPINRFISPTVCEYNIETNCGIFYEKKNRIAGQGDMREGAVFVEEKENQHYYMECFENSDVPIIST